MISTIFLSAPCVADQVYYRYRDENGTLTMASILPPDRADNGYEVISKNGEIIQKIPPKTATITPEKTEPEILTPEEQQKRQDDLLLKSFSSQKEIERSRDEKLASIKIFEGIVQQNLQSLNKQLQDINDSIAAHKEANIAIPPDLQKNLNATLRQIREGEEFLAKKTVEKKEIENRYNNLIKRYNSLHPNTPPATPAPPPEPS